MGTLRADGPSSSSTAFSSMESEPAVETLPRRPAGNVNPVVWMGEVPDSPSVEIDIRRPGAVAAVTGAGCEATPDGGLPDTLFVRPKRAVKVLEVKEPRRWRGEPEESLELLSSPMMACWFVRRMMKLQWCLKRFCDLTHYRTVVVENRQDVGDEAELKSDGEYRRYACR